MRGYTRPILLGFGLAACAMLAPPPVRAADEYYPGQDTWETVTPQSIGADVQKLAKAAELAGEHRSGALLILYDGRILAEHYWQGWDKGTTHPAYSATKSLTSTLVGMAIADGKLELDQSAADFLPEWRGQPQAAITIRHLLSMSSGLEGGRRNFVAGNLARDERKFAVSLPLEQPPGSRWDYHNSAYRLLLDILVAATGQPLEEYTRQRLLQPLGMSDTQWQRKRLTRDQYTFMTTTARDAGRFGLLVMRQGKWNGQQLLDPTWLQRATQPADARVNPSYGFLWWLNGGSSHYLPLNPQLQTGPIFPGCPADCVAALGKNDQKIYIVPSRRLVVVRLGDAAESSTPALSSFDAQLLGAICASLGSDGK